MTAMIAEDFAAVELIVEGMLDDPGGHLLAAAAQIQSLTFRLAEAYRQEGPPNFLTGAELHQIFSLASARTEASLEENDEER